MYTGLLVAVLALLCLVALPVWPWSRRWGYAGGGGILLLLALVGLLMYGNAL